LGLEEDKYSKGNSMGTFDSVYLNKIRLLEEENRKLKQILSEASEETPAAFGMMARAATDRVMGNKIPLDKMSSEEAFQHGADHAMLQGISTPPHFFKNRHFAAGFHSMLRTGIGEQDDVPDLKGYDLPRDYDGPGAEDLD